MVEAQDTLMSQREVQGLEVLRRMQQDGLGQSHAAQHLGVSVRQVKRQGHQRLQLLADGGILGVPVESRGIGSGARPAGPAQRVRQPGKHGAQLGPPGFLAEPPCGKPACLVPGEHQPCAIGQGPGGGGAADIRAEAGRRFDCVTVRVWVQGRAAVSAHLPFEGGACASGPRLAQWSDRPWTIKSAPAPFTGPPPSSEPLLS
jgi:hypothetical protein